MVSQTNSPSTRKEIVMSQRKACQGQRPAQPKRPVRTRLQVEYLEQRFCPSINLVEVEPNDSPAAAQALPRVPDVHVIVNGDISAGDRDWFRLSLQAGDVVGVALDSLSPLNPAIRLVDAGGNLLIRNDNSLRLGFQGLPHDSPLPTNVDNPLGAELYYVVRTAGTYYLEASAAGDASTGKYKMDLVVARPGLERQPVGTKQVLFIDFDGASVNFSNFSHADHDGGTRRLSPLSAFLGEWGLTPGDENAVIDATLAVMRARLSGDIRALGLNGDYAATGRPGDFDIEIRNSRDDADTFGTDPFVSRVVIGGTPEEAGIPGAGLASDIDPGNFQTNDEAVVTLSFETKALDLIPVQSPHTRIEFIGLLLGVGASHEAGHIFGNFHTDISLTDLFAGVPNLMDANAGLPLLWVPDRVFGTADDRVSTFGVDDYYHNEPFQGVEDTLNTIAFGLSTGKGTGRGSAAAASNPVTSSVGGGSTGRVAEALALLQAASDVPIGDLAASAVPPLAAALLSQPALPAATPATGSNTLTLPQGDPPGAAPALAATA